MGGCFVFDPSVVCGLSVRRGRREICSVRQSRRRMRCVVAVVSLAPSPSEGTNSIDDREGDAASPKEQLVHPEGGVKSPLVVEPSDEFSTGQEGARLEHLRRIGAAGTHTLYRMVEDIRSMMVPSQQVFNIIPSRILSSHLAVDFALVFALFLLLRYGVSRALYFLYHKLDPNRGKVSYKDSVFECMQRPLEFLSVFTVGTAIAEAVARPLSATGATRYLRVSRELGVIVAATWFILRWIERIRSRFAVDGRVDKLQVDSISRLATVVTVVIAVLVMMDTIGLQVQSVLAFGGIGGVAIGFAGREIISNFFAGFMLFLTRPFSVGDWIRSIENTSVEGTVEDMGWYMTMIRTWEKRPLYVPNSRFSTFIIENPSRMSNRRIKHELHLRLEDIPLVRGILEDIERMLQKHEGLDPRQHRLTFLDRFDEHSAVIWVSCYTKTVFLSEYRKTQQDILFEMYDIIMRNGARLTSDLHRFQGPLPVGSYRAHVETQGADSDQQDKAMEETMRASVARREEAQGMDGNSPDTRDKKEKKDVDVRSPSPTVVHRVAVTVSAGVPPSVDKTGTMTIVGEKEEASAVKGELGHQENKRKESMDHETINSVKVTDVDLPEAVASKAKEAGRDGTPGGTVFVNEGGGGSAASQDGTASRAPIVTSMDGKGVNVEIPLVGPGEMMIVGERGLWKERLRDGEVPGELPISGEMRIVGERTPVKDTKAVTPVGREMVIISDSKVPEKSTPVKRTEKEDKADPTPVAKGNQGEMRIFGEHPPELDSPLAPTSSEELPPSVKLESLPPKTTSSGEMHIMGERPPTRESNTQIPLSSEKKVALDPKTENNNG